VRDAVAQTLTELDREPMPPVPPDRVVAVAGTATTLAALDLRLEVYSDEAIEGHLVTRGRLRAWIERLAALSVAERRSLPGMDPGRADVIVAGLVVLDGVLERLLADGFAASGRGVRHGVALAYLAATPRL